MRTGADTVQRHQIQEVDRSTPARQGSWFNIFNIFLILNANISTINTKESKVRMTRTKREMPLLEAVWFLGGLGCAPDVIKLSEYSVKMEGRHMRTLVVRNTRSSGDLWSRTLPQSGVHSRTYLMGFHQL